MKNIKEKYPLLFNNNKEKEKKERYQQALSKAHVIADILKTRFSAKEVRLFGSLLDEERFALTSDIDIAESGIPPESFYTAYAAITREITDFQIDLVDMKDCRESLKNEIETKGVTL